MPMHGNPVPTEVKTDADGTVVGWKNAFGEWELIKGGLTKKIGEPEIKPRSMNDVLR